MQIVIDIPEEDYKFIKDLQFYHSGRRNGRTIEQNVINGIRDGTPLPKGHGDLIDRDETYDVLDNANLSLNCSGLLRYVSTVIPADKEKEE